MRLPVRLRSSGYVLCSLLIFVPGGNAVEGQMPSSWPRAHTVTESANRLRISNPYYSVEHDLTQGGNIDKISLADGSGVLLAAPVSASIRDASGQVFSDTNERNSRVTRRSEGTAEIVEMESRFVNGGISASNLFLKTTYEHHWGYVKVRREITVKSPGVSLSALTPFHVWFSPRLTSFGYREGITEEEKAPAFSFGSCRWGELTADKLIGVRTNYLPRYVMCAERGIKGIEWFMGSDLHQWDLQLTGKRGQGECLLRGHASGRNAVELMVSALKSETPIEVGAGRYVFDSYVGIPIKAGHALKPWMHTSFNRNKGEWVSSDQVRRWADSGIQTVHCHNDGDYYEDGLFWRDGSYPPYPDMDRYDKVLKDCRAAGIRTATYFSNKELHPATREFQEHGEEWGRKNLKGNLQHNIFKGTNEFGAQMCLRSGWSAFLEHSIDRVLKNHPLDGVYYDWNVALLCNNPLHEPKAKTAGAAAHWDIDELLQLMEWTRLRVGQKGLVIIHNTTTPMFAMENFADDIVANEWGYGKWAGEGPELKDLPLEWSLVGARARGVISYGQLDDKSPKRLHRVFALQALLSGVTPWPASPATFDIFPILKAIGDVESCKFLDWRNDAVTVTAPRCASAIYSRPGEAWLLIGNYGSEKRTVTCRLDVDHLPFPISKPSRLTLEARSKPNDASAAPELSAEAFVGPGIKIDLEPDSAVLLKLK